ncbi:GA module-containing protein [Mycoplasma sp. 31_09]|uniref:GA module-containing protein n=1 Tax=Mycoplasma sp. 31_09 TaxID=3401663 RepID=UPI003AAF2197
MKNHKYKVILSSLIATSGICLPFVSISAISTIDTTSSQTNKEIDPLHTGKEQLKKIINTDSKLSQAQKDAFNTQVTNAKVEEDLNNIKVELEALNKLIEEVSTFSKPSISYAFKLSTK